MNITIESLLADAKYLVNRLKDHDSAAESLAEQASILKKEMDARNTYQENLIDLNKVAGHRPRSTLVLGIQQENCAIRSLQQENDELRQSLADHQNALELIMTKYRQQMMQFTTHQNLQVASTDPTSDKEYEKSNLELIEKVSKICEMAAVMRQAADLDDKEYYKDYEELSRLQTENQLLREMLMISKGSQGAGLITIVNKEAEPVSDEDQKRVGPVGDATTVADLVAGDNETIKRNPNKKSKKELVTEEGRAGNENGIGYYVNDISSESTDDTLIYSEDSS